VYAELIELVREARDNSLKYFLERETTAPCSSFRIDEVMYTDADLRNVDQKSKAERLGLQTEN
jgi:hypothetical protein